MNTNKLSTNEINHLKTAKISYYNQQEAIFDEGLKMIIDSYRVFSIKERNEEKEEITNIYKKQLFESEEYLKQEKSLFSIGAYNTNINNINIYINSNSNQDKDNINHINEKLKRITSSNTNTIKSSSFNYQSDRICVLNQYNSNITSRINSNYVKSYINNSSIYKNTVIETNHENNNFFQKDIPKLYIIRKPYEYSHKEGYIKQKLSTYINKSILNQRIDILSNERRVIYTKIFIIICKFLVFMKKIYINKKTKEKLTKTIRQNIKFISKKNIYMKLDDNSKAKKDEKVVPYLNKLKNGRLISCINNEDFIKNYVNDDLMKINNFRKSIFSNSNINNFNLRSINLLERIKSTHDFSYDLKNEIETNKFSGYIRNTMRKQNKTEAENKKKIIFNSLLDSLKQNINHSHIENDEYPNDTCGSIQIRQERNVENNDSESEDLNSNQNENRDLKKMNTRRNNMKIIENNEKDEQFISPIIKVDIVGLKLYINEKNKSKNKLSSHDYIKKVIECNVRKE